MKILTSDDHITQLSQVSKPVNIFNSQLAELCISLDNTMLLHNGFGLAAPQVGIFLRVIVVDFDPFVLINPYIIGAEGIIDTIIEGCLSVPNISKTLNRFNKIQVMYQDLSGTMKIETFEGLDSVVIQHEIDHLDGILITTKEK